MHPDTYDVRKAAGMLSDITLAEQITNHLIHTGSVGAGQSVNETPINDEIRTAMFGDSYPEHVADELNDTIGVLTRTNGLVYQMLDSDQGLSLCTTRVKRKIKTADGGSIVVSKMSRFVSDDPDIVNSYRVDPQVRQLEKKMERVSAIINEDVRRIPALARFVPGLLNRANETMQRELPAPKRDER